MADKAKEDGDRWERLMTKLDRLTDKVVDMDEIQQQLLAQAELAATVAQKAAEERLRLAQRMEQTGREVAEIRLELMARDMESVDAGGNDQNRGDRDRRDAGGNNRRYRDVFPGFQRDGFAGRVENRDVQNMPIPKMMFPRFEGFEPKIWLRKCVDYFTLFHVPEAVWVTSASLNMEGNASRWFEVYKLQHGLGEWPEFAQAVLQKFGVDEYPQAMRVLMDLYQRGTVEEYLKEFDEIRYSTSVHNHTLDETLFVAHFIKGLKPELQGVVQSHLPTTVDRAALLAQMHQSILEKQKHKLLRFSGQSRVYGSVSKSEVKPLSTGVDLSKERVVKEYRRQQGLCFTCGDKFEPDHQNKCPKRLQMQLNALTAEELGMTLTDEVLSQLEQDEPMVEEGPNLSLNAIRGTAKEGCMRVRALVGTQTMLVLVDSGSSNSFINKHFVERLGLHTRPCTMARVQVANGDFLSSAAQVHQLAWWANGHTFYTDLRVLELGAYDAILGFDWLESHSPMNCDWGNRVLSFQDRGETVQLLGDLTEVREVTEISVL